MLAFLGGVFVCAVAVFFFPAIKLSLEDAARERRFLELHALTRQTLPSEQLVALTRELEVIKTAQRIAMIDGASVKDAYRFGQEAAIRSMANYLELERILPG